MTWEELQTTLNEMEKKAKGEALAYYLAKEILRHEKDIVRAKRDLETLMLKGIKIPDASTISPDEWIEP
jgi:hypothetical protein